MARALPERRYESSLHMARALPERKYGKLCRSKADVEQPGVWKVIRRGSAEEEVRKHRDRVTGAWKQISKQRRQVDVSYDPSMVTALRHGTWMDEERFKQTCIKARRRKEGEASTSFSTAHG